MKIINQGLRVKRRLICVRGESVTIYHSERVETVFPGVCFHGDSVMHHMLSAASICSHLRRRRSLHETRGNLHLLKPTVSYRLFAPKMSVNSLGDSGKTSPRAGINIQLLTGWWRILRESFTNGRMDILVRNNWKFKGWCQGECL